MDRKLYLYPVLALVMFFCGISASFASDWVTHSEVSSLVADVVPHLGTYEGYRETPDAIKLTQLQKRYFELLHGGKADEAGKLQETQINHLEAKVKRFACRLTTKTLSYTERKVFDLLINLAPLTEKEGDAGGTMTMMFWLSLTPDQFIDIFSGKKALTDQLVHNDTTRGMVTTVTTEINGNTRKVSFKQVYTEGSKILDLYTAVIEMRDEQMVKIVVDKHRRKFGKLRPVLNAAVVGIRQTAEGLEAGKSGRLVSKTFIEKALADKTDAGFAKLVREEAELYKKIRP